MPPSLITIEDIRALAVEQRLVERISPTRDLCVIRHAGARAGSSWLRVYVRNTETRGTRMPTVEKRDSKSDANAMRSVAEFRRKHGGNPHA
jgi:hypothetical protein